MTNIELGAFIKGFFGYGDLNAQIWFIGMEEGGGNTFDEIVKRLSIWTHSGSPKTVALYDFHRKLGLSHYFESSTSPKLQPTWNKLIRYQLSYEGASVTTESVRAFQVNRLGRFQSKTCLLELLPLPSPSINTWVYKDFSNLPEIKSRTEYRNRITPIRIRAIRKLIDAQKPKRVIFYGKTYQSFWTNFVNETTKWRIKEEAVFTKENDVEYMILPHPTARSVTNAVYEKSSLLKI